MIERRKGIFNFDESVINSNTLKNMSWMEKSESKGRFYKRTYSGLSLLLSVSSDGEIISRFLNGNNNEFSVAAFLIDVSRVRDRLCESWRSNYVLLLDNCASIKQQR